MQLKLVFGWAVAIYAVVFLAWSGFLAYGLGGTLFARLGSLAALVIVTTVAARSIGRQTWQEMLPYSAAWAGVIAVLDGLYTAPFTGLAVYADINVWIGYALVVLVPLASAKNARTLFSKEPHAAV